MSDMNLTVIDGANSALDLVQQMANNQVQLAEEQKGTGYESAFIRAQRISTQVPTDDFHRKIGIGSLKITFSRDDSIYPRAIAVYPMDIIGTKGGFDKSNPTPRRWPVDYNDKKAIEKYGYDWCFTRNGIQPDPVTHDPKVEPIHGRTLVHPGAKGRDSVVVKAGYGSEKTIEIPTSIVVDENTYCNSCFFKQSWWAADDPEGSPATLNAPCRPNPAGVFYIIGAEGFNRLGRERRMIGQVRMFKQATRTFFSRGPKHNDTAYQKAVGIYAPMDAMIAAKPLEDLLPNSVTVDVNGQSLVFIFPYLLGVLLKEEDVGASDHPFLCNPAEMVRGILRSTDGDLPTRYRKAVRNAASAYIAKIGVMSDAERETNQIEELLLSTIVVTSDADSMKLYAEYKQAWDEYHREVDGQKQGRAKLTAPFQAGAFGNSDEEETSVSSTATAPSVVAPLSPEAQAQSLQALNNLAALNEAPLFGQEPDEPEIEEDDDDEGSTVASLFFGNLD